MGRRLLKYKMVHAYGARKQKSPRAKKTASRSPASAAQHSTEVTHAQPSTSGTATVRASADDAVQELQPSTSGTATVHASVDAVQELQPSTSGMATVRAGADDAGTIQAHLELRFVLEESSREVAAKVQAKLNAVSATARKLELTGDGHVRTGTEQVDESLVIQVTTLNALICISKCLQCSQPGLSIELGTRQGLAARMILTCALCGAVAKEWSSTRKEGHKILNVTMRAVHAVKSTGRRATALTDLWSIVNMSHRGLHHKTYQKHLKAELRPASEAAAANVFSDSVKAVRDVYSEMEPYF